MKIGYACIPLTTRYRTNRSFNIKNFNYDIFIKIVEDNLKDLMKILENNVSKRIYLFRISSDIIPFGGHEINDIKWWDIFQNQLSQIGNYIKQNGIRVSMHPGQYTVLNSNSEGTVQNSVRELDYHSLFLDSLGVDYSCKLVLHGGGVYGDKTAAMERFKRNYYLLSQSARRRLVLENDERSYTIDDILLLCHELKIPAVFDNLHHKFNHSAEKDIASILNEVSETWRSEDGAMKLHYSDEDPNKQKGAHSKFVITENFLHYTDIVSSFDPDIMLEVKDKDISAVKCINCFGISKSAVYDEWARYKYAVMEHNYNMYKNCSSLIKNNCSIIELYSAIDSALLSPFDEGNFINTAEHVWGYFKDRASEKERSKFFDLLKGDDTSKVKVYLYKLTEKYSIDYLLKSYYFTY